jgi:VanZ family protein
MPIARLKQITARGWRRLLGAALACYWIAMFIGTHVPMPKLPDLPKSSDKWMHFGAYAGLAFLLATWTSFRHRHDADDTGAITTGRLFAPLSVWTYALLFAATLVYAIADELLQIPVNRHAEVRDFLADMIGSAIGLGSFAACSALLGASHLLRVKNLD